MMAVNVEIRKWARVSVERVQDLQRVWITKVDFSHGHVTGNDESVNESVLSRLTDQCGKIDL